MVFSAREVEVVLEGAGVPCLHAVDLPPLVNDFTRALAARYCGLPKALVLAVLAADDGEVARQQRLLGATICKGILRSGGMVFPNDEGAAAAAANNNNNKKDAGRVLGVVTKADHIGNNNFSPIIKLLSSSPPSSIPSSTPSSSAPAAAAAAIQAWYLVKSGLGEEVPVLRGHGGAAGRGRHQQMQAVLDSEQRLLQASYPWSQQPDKVASRMGVLSLGIAVSDRLNSLSLPAVAALRRAASQRTRLLETELKSLGEEALEAGAGAGAGNRLLFSLVTRFESLLKRHVFAYRDALDAAAAAGGAAGARVGVDVGDEGVFLYARIKALFKGFQAALQAASPAFQAPPLPSPALSPVSRPLDLSLSAAASAASCAAMEASCAAIAALAWV